MLDPRSRGALLEALRPPDGYQVDAAVATTYSLDLLALMTAPLAFSLYDRVAAKEKDGPRRVDSFALLHAVRKHAERLVVFCQAGGIAKPKGYRQLLTYLEDSVVQVKAPTENGVFHPKVWVTRLVTAEGPVRYRILCLSRNLTFDRSWDTMLTFDGEVVPNRTSAIAESRPFAAFVEALPRLAITPMGDSRADIVALMAKELRVTRFEVPQPFETFRFWPIGIDAKRVDPFKDTRIDRLLVVSPFVESAQLGRLTEVGARHVLVSRVDQLAVVKPEALDAFSEVLVLHDAAEQIDDGEDEAVDDSDDATCLAAPPSGLHAKLYVADEGWDAHVWTGSANATNAAFSSNVELLVQLTGKRSKVGVQEFLGTEDEGLRALLTAFSPGDAPAGPSELQQQLDELVRRTTRSLACVPWDAKVAPDTPEQNGTETFSVSLQTESDLPTIAPECSVRVWPIALSAERALAMVPGTDVRFERCSLQALTAFYAFELTASSGGRVERSTFVVRATLTGAPADRSARVIQALLDDPAKVLRFLRMLLAGDGQGATELLGEAVTGERSGSQKSWADDVPVFESLVRTLEREPHRLLEVDRLVRELAGAKLLPPDFDVVWKPLWSVFCSLHQPEVAP